MISAAIEPSRDAKSLRARITAGVIAGLVGGVVIWLYEAVVWVHVQHLLPLEKIPSNATGLVFGNEVQASLGAAAAILGTLIHFSFAALWGVGFALVWPWFHRRGVEATLLALVYAVIAWVMMHVAIALVSDNHPNYLDSFVIINGLMSHIFFTVPLALVVRRRLA